MSMNDQLSRYDLQSIDNETDMKQMVEEVNAILNSGKKDDNSLKLFIVEFLQKLLDNITSTQSSPKSIFMSVYVLREFVERNTNSDRKQDKNSKLFSFLMSHKLMKHLVMIAETTDPFKQINEKGKTFFPKDSKTGNDFIRVILQLIKILASKYRSTRQNDPTAFKRNYDALTEKKVIFPSQYIFFTAKRQKKEEQHMADSTRYRSSQLKQEQPDRTNLKSDINFMFKRLKQFIVALNEDELEYIQTEIRTVHSLIQKQKDRYQRLTEEVLKLNDEDITMKFFSIQDFMTKQMDIHRQHIDNSKDFQTYITLIKIQAEKQLDQIQIKQTPNSNPPKDLSKKIQSSKGATISSKIKEEDVKQSAFDPTALKAVSSYFNRLEQRSKSPINGGFKKINDSLSKQKNNVIKSNVKRSISPINRTKMNITKSMTSLKDSKIAQIFTNPPNPNPPRKNYDGRQIPQNLNISEMLHSITKSQGLRRFKTANFKSKSSLFENEHIQIGYKSQPIYEQVSGFKVLIKIQLYFGNLSEQTIKNITLDFKGDPSILLYANPRFIQSILVKGDQGKIQLIIIPIKPPFPLLTMNLSYQNAGTTNQIKIILPNSVLKLTHFMDITKTQFLNRWNSAEIYKTTQFKLCHYLPPDTFVKWISSLSQLTSYATFSVSGSKQDYELFTSLIMLQRYQGLLKICIRPNLGVVLQMGIEDRNEQSVNYFIFFLETLQQLLREIE